MSIEPSPRDIDAAAAGLPKLPVEPGWYGHAREMWWMLAAQLVVVLALIAVLVM
ncbi:hypothetical protein I546_3598 [Mycobacterium kansasii 732]|uniref:hypothetical protein n=1 Tax=Mycobacterium pseudokansasii TaxID=2341080 RepID=UPI00044D47DC|nr:hypothetical protein [Mycobacterium pseudokansasii]EUA10865.1 hypothetical protein I546_3598 [Mycobacterium kansasii 732]MBY0391279.1 hypothetical protein [Mycobacterium pseudokansasii]VAZ97173.1 hypothetical protein LAUMK35_03581 [Mycobacterium pseudokansasii]VAZ98573.1 hypothetical protein LAUMK21_03578 [Mycobacterium pseudokansasii]